MRRANRLSREQMLRSIPRLHPDVRWERLDSGQIMAIYRAERGLFGRLWTKVFALPETSQVALDEPGSAVIEAIDGTRTIHELIGFVGGRFKLSRKEAEAALLKYMDMLARRRLVGFEIKPEASEDV